MGEHCIFTVNHITNMTYESRKAQHKNLFFAFVDFKKAYDSVDRWSLIKAMRKYGVHTEIIEVIIQIYSEDNTTIKLGDKEEKIEVTSIISVWTPYFLIAFI